MRCRGHPGLDLDWSGCCPEERFGFDGGEMSESSLLSFYFVFFFAGVEKCLLRFFWVRATNTGCVRFRTAGI